MEAWQLVHGIFLQQEIGLYMLASLIAVLAVGYLGAPLWVWSVVLLTITIGFGLPVWALGILVVGLLLFNIKPLRRMIVSKPLMSFMKGIMPKISETERTALEAGVVWVEG